MHQESCTMSRLLICGSPDTTGINCCEIPYPYIVPDCVEACVIDAIRPHIDPVLNDLANAVRFGLMAKCVPYERRAQDLANLRDILIQSFRDRMRLFYAGSADLTMAQVFENYGIACALEYFRNRYKIDITSILFAAGIVRPGRVLSASEQARLAVPSNMLCAPVPDTIYPVTTPVYPPLPPLEPCELVPDFIVEDTIDSADVLTMPPGTYLITTGDPLLVSNVVTDGTIFTVPSVGRVIHDLDTDTYWIMTGAGVMPFLTPLTLTLSGSSYTLTSDHPSQSALSDRVVVVYAVVGGVQTLVYAGPESGLPITFPASTLFTSLVVTYFYEGCPYVAPGTVTADPEVEGTFDCSDGPTPWMYRYNTLAVGNNSWLFDNSNLFGETITLAFITGEIAADAVVSFYDGPTNASPLIVAFSAMDMAGQVIISTGSTLFMQITQADTAMAADLDTWWWQVGCTSGYGFPVASVAITEKCDSYEIGLTVTIGSFSGASAAISYTVDGGAPTVITGLAPGVYPLGSFPYNSVVVVTVIDEDDPVLASIILGSYTGSGDCDDPCLPDGIFKLDMGGDLADLPDPAPDTTYLYLVVTDLTGIGTAVPGDIMNWDNGLQVYFIEPAYTGLLAFGDPLEYWYGTGTGGGPATSPYPIFPVMFLNPTGNTPNNWELECPSVTQFDIPDNTPFEVEVRMGAGDWMSAGFYTLQQLITPLGVSIPMPFTEARVKWFYVGDCAVIRYILIDPQV
jgi:hypothetical protein